MGRYVKTGDGRPGGGNGKYKDEWGKGAYDEPTGDGDHLQGLHDFGDTIDGMGGDDNINGFSGNDILIGGTGADDITTGQGADTVVLGEQIVNDPQDATDDEFPGDEFNDTVNIGVGDDPNDGTTDLFDTILGYEAAETGVEPDTFVTKDVVALDGIGASINQFVEGGTGTSGASADGDIVYSISAEELEQFLWVEDGKLIFDADGNADGFDDDDDVLATLTAPDGSAASDGVTVRFEAEIEVVSDFSLGETAVQPAEYVAVWDDGTWSISIDGGDWMVV